jgi:hypothetical protein
MDSQNWIFHRESVAALSISRGIRLNQYLWHGEMDANAPIPIRRYMAAAIPNNQAFSYAGEGHLSLISKYLEEILNVLFA